MAAEVKTLTPPPATEDHDAALGTREIFVRASWRDPALSSASQAGMVNDGLAWGLFPLFFAASIARCTPLSGCILP